MILTYRKGLSAFICILTLLLLLTTVIIAQDKPFVPQDKPASETSDQNKASNIFFLDRSKGEPELLINQYETKEDKDAETLSNLGWLYFIYKNDATTAQNYFQQAIDKDNQNLNALEGLASIYYFYNDFENGGKLALQYLQTAPDEPRSELLVRFLDYNYFHIRLPFSQRMDILSTILKKPLDNKINEFLIRKELISYRQGVYGQSDQEAFNLWKQCGYIDKWLVMGYFGPYGNSAFNEVFPPERETKLNKKYSVQDWELAYHKRKATITNYDRFNYHLTKPLTNTGSTIYLLTYINSPSERPIALRINDINCFKVWMNNRLVAEINPFSSHQPREMSIGTYLNSGWNKLLLKVVSNYAGDIRITDPEGKTYDDLSYEIDFPDDVLPEVKPLPGQLPKVKCFMGASDMLTQRIKDPLQKTISDYEGLAALHYYINGLMQESFKLYEELYNFHQDNSDINYTMARAYEINEYLPNEKRMNQARLCAERALELNTQNIIALSWLAQYYDSKDKDKSLKYLKQASQLKPDSLEIHLQLANHFQQRNWQGEYFNELQALNNLKPDSPVVWSQWRGYYEQIGNKQKSYEYALRRQKFYGTKYDWPTISYRYQIGDYDYVIKEYLKVAEENPEETSYLEYLVGYYRIVGKYEEAEKYYLKILELEPEKAYTHYNDIAQFYWEWKKQDKAKEFWTKAITLPMKYSIYNRDNNIEFLDFLSANSDWKKDYEIITESVITQAPGEKEYPNVSTIILLEQHLVKLIGNTELISQDETVHQVVKIMNKKGGERYGDLYQRGKVEQARVFLPDGRILEPEPIQDGGMRLPELDKGAILDVKYSNRRPYSYRPPDDIQKIFSTESFRRPKEPILHLQYVLIVPKELKYTLKQKNMGNIKPQILEKDNAIIYIWEVKNQEDYDPEQWMPDDKELFPWVDIYQGGFSMDKMNQETISQYLEEKVPDNVRDKASELTNDLNSRDDKIRTLYQFCVTEIKGSGGGKGGGEDTSLSQTLIEKQGSIASLFMAMLRACGIEAYWALARPRFRPNENIEKNGPNFDNIGLIYLPSEQGEGQELFLVPEQFQPFGVIPTDIQGGYAYVVLKNGARTIDIPSAPIEQRCSGAVNITINVNKDGTSECKGALEMGGAVGAQFRMSLKEYSTEQQKKMIVEAVVNQLFQGAKLKEFDIPAFDITEPLTRIEFECQAPQFLTKTKTGWKFKPIIRPLQLSQYFLRETTRKFPLRFSRYLIDVINTVDLLYVNIPDGIKTIIPPNITLWTEFGSYSLSIIQKDNLLEIERRLLLHEIDISVEAYQRFVDFCKKIEGAEKTTIYLEEVGE